MEPADAKPPTGAYARSVRARQRAKIQRLGLRVPRDVSAVGCDALRLVREWPGLASLRVQHEAIATCVANWITGEISAAKTRGEALLPKTRRFACALADGWTMGPAPDAGVW